MHVVGGAVRDDEESVAGNGKSERTLFAEVPLSRLEKFSATGVEPPQFVDLPEIDRVGDQLGPAEGSLGKGTEPAGFTGGQVEAGEGADAP